MDFWWFLVLIFCPDILGAIPNILNTLKMTHELNINETYTILYLLIYIYIMSIITVYKIMYLYNNF